MNIQDKTVILPYGKQDMRTAIMLSWIFPVIMLGTGIFLGIIRRQGFQHCAKITGICVLMMLPISIGCLIYAWNCNRKKRKGVCIRFSPEGITTAKGELIPMAEIKSCGLLSRNDEETDSESTKSTSAKILYIYKTDGTSVKINLKSFEAYDYGNEDAFIQAINETLGRLLIVRQ